MLAGRGLCAFWKESGSGEAPLCTNLWKVLAQLTGYPHKPAPARSCCMRAPPFARAATQALASRKLAPALAKPALSTARGLLYYYCYLLIYLLKNNQNFRKPRRRTRQKAPVETWRGPHRAKLHWRPTHATASPIAEGNQPGEDVKGSSWAGPHHAAEIPRELKKLSN